MKMNLKIFVLGFIFVTVNGLFIGCSNSYDYDVETTTPFVEKMYNREDSSIELFDKRNLNQNSEGKLLYQTIISLRKSENYSQFVEELENIIQDEERDIKEITETEMSIYVDLYNDFKDSDFLSFLCKNKTIHQRINEEVDNKIERELLLNAMYSLQWIKLGFSEIIDEELEETEEDYAYVPSYTPPTPGSNESYDNYIDRCMKGYIEAKITYGSWLDRISTVLDGPKGLLAIFTACSLVYALEK